MARRRRPHPVPAQAPAAPERLARCWVEDWVVAEDVVAVREALADTLTEHGLAVDHEGEVLDRLVVRAWGRYRRARLVWAAEAGLSAAELVIVCPAGRPAFRDRSAFVRRLAP